MGAARHNTESRASECDDGVPLQCMSERLVADVTDHTSCIVLEHMCKTLASCTGHLAVCSFLLVAGSSPEQLQQTPLCYACDCMLLWLCAQTLISGTDVNTAKIGKVLLHEIAQQRSNYRASLVTFQDCEAYSMQASSAQKCQFMQVGVSCAI